MEVSLTGTSIVFRSVFLTAFSTASGTSPAFPYPHPTRPFRFPTTTIAEKLNRRPPLTTHAHRRISTTFSGLSARISDDTLFAPNFVDHLRHTLAAFCGGQAKSIQFPVSIRTGSTILKKPIPPGVPHQLIITVNEPYMYLLFKLDEEPLE